VVCSWLIEDGFVGRGLVEGYIGGIMLEWNPPCSLSASIFASLAAFRALAAASWANLAAFSASNKAAAAGDNPGPWRAWMTFFLKASSLVFLVRQVILPLVLMLL
jgi:hypothetical protein